ncbi:MAG: DUF3592 domain-containing protein [Candidatus Fermentibacteraceae bacterium]
MAVWGINWSVFKIFILLGIGMIVAGFLVSPEARTDDGHPLNIFLWAFGGFWLVMDLSLILVIRGMAARRKNAFETWMPATAKVLSASETGTYINNLPKIRFTLEVTSDTHGVYQVEHREVVSMLHIASYGVGSVHQVRVDPGNPQKLMFAD